MEYSLEIIGRREKSILSILKKNQNRGITSAANGLTITDIVEKSKFSRSTVINILSKLEGAGKISFRKIGMAKLYYLLEDKK